MGRNKKPSLAAGGLAKTDLAKTDLADHYLRNILEADKRDEKVVQPQTTVVSCHKGLSHDLELFLEFMVTAGEGKREDRKERQDGVCWSNAWLPYRLRELARDSPASFLWLSKPGADILHYDVPTNLKIPLGVIRLERRCEHPLENGS